MKLLLVVTMIIFSVSVFADDCKVKFKVGEVEVEELVCNIQGAETSDKYKDLYERCKSKCNEQQPEELEGDANEATLCNDDKQSGKDVNKYEVDANGNIKAINQ